jgi:hypothetical protein
MKYPGNGLYVRFLGAKGLVALRIPAVAVAIREPLQLETIFQLFDGEFLERQIFGFGLVPFLFVFHVCHLLSI